MAQKSKQLFKRVICKKSSAVIPEDISTSTNSEEIKPSENLSKDQNFSFPQEICEPNFDLEKNADSTESNSNFEGQNSEGQKDNVLTEDEKEFLCFDGQSEVFIDDNDDATAKLVKHLNSVLYQEIDINHDIDNCIYCKKELDVFQISDEDSTVDGCHCKQGLTVELYMNDFKAIHFYSGLESYEKFCFVLNTLGPAAYELNHVYGKPSDHISVANRFFLTLIRLREHKTYYELSLIFKTSEKQVMNIFITWIRFMRLQWGEIDQWPDKDLVNAFAPSDFSRKFPKVRLIIDGTEIEIKRSSNPTAQKATFSYYKNKNTAKTIVGTTPGGLLSALTPAYAGSATDRQIVERMDILDRLEPGDAVMADKGFDIADILASRAVDLNIPTFFRKGNQITPETLKQDRKISSKRVHIERVIGLGKTYKILQGPLTTTETIMADDIIFSCFMLCNFRRPIIDEYA